MTTLAEVSTASRAHGLTITRQGKAFHSRGHVNIHRFMEALPPSARQSLEAPQHLHGVMVGPFVQIVPESRKGSFPVTITYHTPSKRRLYARLFPVCGNCGLHVCTEICRRRNGVGARR